MAVMSESSAPREHTPNNYQSKKKKKKKKYALLLAAHDSDYVKKVYGGYFEVFKLAFEEDGEVWDLYRVVDGEFPEMTELDNYDGFIISGSPYDAYGDDKWIQKLCVVLRTIYKMEKNLLGICFGHQVLCRAMGGKVRKSYTGWDIGLREVRIVKGFLDCSKLWEESIIPKSLSVIECHQDEVLEVPCGGEVVAYSDKTKVEMFKLGNHVMGIQGHPEYTKDILYNLIDRLLHTNSIEKGFAEDARYAVELSEPDRRCWEKICRSFLKGRRLWT